MSEGVSGIGGQSSSDIRTDYMKLLITQLQNQNPLEPVSNDQMAMQLAQFSQLEQLENVNSRFASLLTAMDDSYANSLLGKKVTFQQETEDGPGEPQTGLVEEISNENSAVELLIGSSRVSLEDVLSIKNP